MDAIPDPDPNLLHEVHEALAGRLPEFALDVLAGAILAGRREEALALATVPGIVAPGDAAAYVDGLVAIAGTGRGGNARLDAAGVREDLRMQPCQSDVAELAANGYRDAAALLAVLHEGYPGAAARAAADGLASELAGTPVRLVEIAPGEALPAPDGQWEGPRHLVRIGDALVPGLFRAGAKGSWFEGASGRRVPLSRVAQAWKVLAR